MKLVLIFEIIVDVQFVPKSDCKITKNCIGSAPILAVPFECDSYNAL